MRAFLRSILLLALLWAAGPASGQAPVWEVDPAPFETSMTVVGVYAPGGTPSVNAGDRVAAFVGGELRGVALPVRSGEHNVFFLTVYGHGGGGEVTFAAYDALHAQVRPLAERETYTPNGHLGSVASPFAWTPEAPAAAPGPPVWATEGAVDPGAFEHSLNAVGEVFVGGAHQAHPDDRVAAFARGELRGVAAPQSVNGRMRYYLTAYGHASDHEAVVTLRYWDAAQGVVRAIAEGFPFRADAVYGLDAPLGWHAGHTSGSAPRWALMATPGEAVDAHAFEASMNLIARLADVPEDEAAGQRVAAFVGGELRGVAETDGDGVLWMTLFGAPSERGEALTFFWWDGAKNQLRALSSGVVFAPGTLAGSPDAPHALSTADHRAATSADWAVDPAAYSGTMSVIARVDVDGRPLANADARVAAFAGHDVRGVGAPMADGSLAGYVFLTVHGETAGEALTVQVYDPATGTVYASDAAFTFSADAVLGSVDAPLVWRAEAAHVFVWPGDADGSGQVDDGDVEAVHVHFGASGTPATPGTRGEAISRPVWPGYPGAARADTDFNGEVNQNDVLPIGVLFGERPATGEGDTTPSPQSVANPVVITLEARSTVVRPGDEVDLAVRVDGAPLGAGAQLRIDPALFEFVGFSFGDGVPAAVQNGTAIAFARLLGDPAAGVAFALAGKRTLLEEASVVLNVRLRVRGGVSPQEYTVGAERTAAVDLSGTPLAVTSTPLTLTLIEGTSDEAEVGLPVVDALGTPWPHPVHGAAHVEYELARAGIVHLTLYDALGREVRTLAGGVRTAGQHRTAWSAEGLPAGVYVLRLRTESGVQTRRVTVVR